MLLSPTACWLSCQPLRPRCSSSTGQDDPRPIAATDSPLAATRDARQTVIAGAGHSPWVEKPNDTRQLILGFVTADPRPAD